MSRAFLERCPRRHLLLHMDINKTIIQVDLAGGRSMEDVLNSNAAANVLGYVNDSGSWVPVCGPHDERPQQKSTQPQLVSYDGYIDKLYHEPPGMQDLPKEQRDAVWKSITTKRKEATHKFTFPGEIGHSYASLVEEQRACLTVTKEPPRLYTIIPSFFHLINTLSELDWPFTLVFRTFGSDLKSVLDEWRQFVSGSHVCKPSGPFLQRLRDAPVDPNTGCMYRDGERLFLCHGPCVSAYTLNSPVLNGGHEVSAASVRAELLKLPNATTASETNFELLGGELERFFARSGNVGGLVDYYPSWAQAAERRVGGKVFPVYDSSNRYHVFFDDNIFLGDERSIVDLRNASSGKSVLGASEEEPFCVAVNAFEAITQADYFVDALCKCLQLQLGLAESHH